VPFLLGLKNTNNQLDSEQSLCPLKMVSGVPCPSCGITKSIVYFYNGNITKSLEFHLLGPLTVIVCFYLLIFYSLELYLKRPLKRPFFFHKKALWGLIIFLGIYHFIRLFYFFTENSWDDILKESIWR
jgi:hypothetical protein